MENSTILAIIYSLVTIIICLLAYIALKRRGMQQTEAKMQLPTGVSKPKKNVQKQTKSKAPMQPVEDHAHVLKFKHPWMVSTMKGSNGIVFDICPSPNDKMLAVVAGDKAVFVWVTKRYTDKDKRSIRVNIPNHNATHVCWSPDNTAFMINRLQPHLMEVYRIGRTADNEYGNIKVVEKWCQDDNDDKTVGIGIACTGRYVMGCSEDGNVFLRDVRGNKLSTFSIEDRRLPAIKAIISPCGRFVLVATERSIDVFQVQTEDTIENGKKAVRVKDVKKKWVMQPSNGLITDVCDFDCSGDCSKVVVLTRIGDWRLYDITGNRIVHECDGQLDSDVDLTHQPVVRITTDGRIVAVGASKSIYFFSGFSGGLLHEISNIYFNRITCVAFNSDRKYVITGGDNRIYIFNNISWFEESIARLQGQLCDANVTGALRTRLTNELKNLEQELKKLKE